MNRGLIGSRWTGANVNRERNTEINVQIESGHIEDGDRFLSIGEFARRSRLSAKALRLYDRTGVLVPAAVDEYNGYRMYRPSQLATARLVALLRRLDMPLALVAEMVSGPKAEQVPHLDAYWASVESRLLSLTSWIGEAMGRLVTAAAAGDGPSGPPMVVYHGQVNEDSDGPVEVCVPVAPGNPGESVADRVELAHREAYLTITKAQVEFPQILSAYDAVAQWVSEQQLTVAGSPREVYFTDFGAAAADDQVCDIAFPIERSDQ